MPFQWSHSADWLLRKCHRRFWFQQVYASPNSNWDSPRRKASILSNVNTVEQWRGNVVHDIIAQYILPYVRQYKVLPPTENVRQEAELLAQHRLEFSKNKKFLEEKMTKKKATDEQSGYCFYTIIWEDVFDSAVSTVSIEEAIDQIHVSIDNLMTLDDLFKEISASTWNTTEAGVRVKEGNIPITGRIDLAYFSRNENILNLIDWKVSESSNYDYAPQLWLYAYLLKRATRYAGDGDFTYKLLPDNVRFADKNLIEINLLKGEQINHDWSKLRDRQVNDRILEAVRKLEAILDGRDHKKVPVEELDVARRPQTCRRCPFHEPCQEL